MEKTFPNHTRIVVRIVRSLHKEIFYKERGINSPGLGRMKFEKLV
jgi:hypothetical protein